MDGEKIRKTRMKLEEIDINDCIRILNREGCSKEVIEHSKKVHFFAMEMAKKAREKGAIIDTKLVSIGAMLHDIGRSKTHGIKHAIEGAKMAKEMGFPSDVIKIIERHIGAGLTKDEAAELGLPPKDYRPKTLEEKIVAHADNLVDGDIDKQIKKLKRKNEKAGERMLKMHKSLGKFIK